MTVLRVAPIVEGHGEVPSVRILLTRLGEMLGGWIDVLRPIRVPRGTLLKADGLQRAAGLALFKLGEPPREADCSTILVLLDANGGCPKQLASQSLDHVKDLARSDTVSCVIANVEYETWFVAAADSLTDFLSIPDNGTIPENPEQSRSGKAWIERHFRGGIVRSCVLADEKKAAYPAEGM